MKRQMGPELLAVRAKLERWRRERTSPASRIPQDLWDEAVRVAAIEGVNFTAKTLRFEYYALKKRVDAARGGPGGSGLATVADPALERTTFMQVQLPAQLEQQDGRMVVEMAARDGDRMRIEAQGATCADLAGMVRAFWSRAS